MIPIDYQYTTRVSQMIELILYDTGIYISSEYHIRSFHSIRADFNMTLERNERKREVRR